MLHSRKEIHRQSLHFEAKKYRQSLPFHCCTRGKKLKRARARACAFQGLQGEVYTAGQNRRAKRLLSSRSSLAIYQEVSRFTRRDPYNRKGQESEATVPSLAQKANRPARGRQGGKDGHAMLWGHSNAFGKHLHLHCKKPAGEIRDT
eukprot:281034-Pelagomonas_calceolata.AAC.3